MFSLWARPTIPFKLECEHLNAKQDIISEIKDTVLNLNTDSDITSTAYLFALQVLVFLCASSLLIYIPTMVGAAICVCGCKSHLAFGIWDTILISAHAFVGAWGMHKLTEPLRSYES